MDVSLRYLVRTRLRNRLRQWIGKLRTAGGVIGLLVIVLVVVGAFSVGDWGGIPPTQRQAVFTVLLGFLLWSGILSGLGQRGLVYAPADLDFLFPGPFPKRQLVVYQFAMQYVAAAIMTLVYLVVFGARFLPHPGWFCAGAFLCQITSAHLATAAAEASMLIADSVFRRVRAISVALLIAVSVGAIGLLVAGIAGWGDVPARLERVMSGTVLEVLLFPAVQASELGLASAWGERLVALGRLVLCVAGSFFLVVWIPADVVEGSFAASRRVQKRMEQMRRGVVSGAKDARSASLPRVAWLQGAGGIVWLNVITLRRQLRAVVGGLLVVVMIFAVVATRGVEQRSGGLDRTLLSLLAMVPLWMHLPIGFRLPRDQLAALRALPSSPARIALALLAVPVLVPFLLQAAGVAFLAFAGVLSPAGALLALPCYLAVAATLLTVEAMFVLRKPHATAVNVVQAMAQLLVQMLALLPGLAALLAVTAATDRLELGLPAGALLQAAAATALLARLGRQFQTRELPGLSD